MIRGRRESGQVVITGIVMMLIIALTIFLLFDIHNVIRAKLKTETAQQAAALTGARWQLESLNLIGELNLIKACESLLADDARWSDAGTRSEDEAENRAVLRARLALLTEMQTRISFIGPLIGFAAAQQSAKANGLNPQDSLANYLWLLDNDWRYQQIYGGAVDVIRNYRWRQPYADMIRSIGEQGIAVYPNARLANNPSVEPTELYDPNFYAAIRKHAEEIDAGTATDRQSSWHDGTYDFVKYWRQSDFNGKWWNIDYSMAEFPNESEIFTLGLEFSSSAAGGETAFPAYRNILQQMVPSQDVYQQENFPSGMQWCRYDRFWYPSYYREKYSGYDRDHYDYWFDGTALRRPVKEEYRYEGPAAYVEGTVSVDSVSRFRMRQGTKKPDIDRRLYDRGIRSTRIGSRRGTSDSAQPTLSDYRPGAIAKVLGSLNHSKSPLEIPLVLPVFRKTALMPTYMPLPYGFGVLRPGRSLLERFLNWLADQESLWDYTVDPPAGTEGYLAALQRLCDGEGFRYYGYNPDFDAEEFDRAYGGSPKSLLAPWEFPYAQGTNPSGAGWLQLPQIFTLPAEESEIKPGDIMPAPDYINGGKAKRICIDKITYMVVNSKGHVVTNDEADPTRRYGSIGGGGGGGPGYSNHGVAPDMQVGPPRL